MLEWASIYATESILNDLTFQAMRYWHGYLPLLLDLGYYHFNRILSNISLFVRFWAWA